MFRKVLILGLSLGLLLLTVSCATAAEASTVRVTAGEWSLTPSIASVKAGDVTFEVTNQGRAVHEVVVLKTDLAANALKLKVNGAEVDENGSGQVLGEVEDIGSAQTGSMTLNLAPGRYVLVCNIVGHYNAGMVTAIEVS